MPSENVLYTTIAMSHSGRVLFVGTSAGTIRTIKYPLPVKNVWTEYQGHAAPITKVDHRVSYQTLTLIYCVMQISHMQFCISYAKA